MIDTLIIIHALTGGIALVTGSVAIIARKGAKPHVFGGRVFFWSMLISAALALIIAIIPGHENHFLFSIGVITIYLLVTGFRRIRFSPVRSNLIFDMVFAWIMITSGACMIILPVLFFGSLSIVLAIFGALGIAFAINDLANFSDKRTMVKRKIPNHLWRITSAYISSVTAFIVVNNFIPGLAGWVLPGVTGGIFIAFQLRKYRK